MAADAFAVMRDGMKGKVGIGKLALYGREYLVAVRPHERGIVMHTLHHAAEIRSIDSVEELNSVPAKVKPEEMKLAKQVIETFERRSTSPTTRTSTAKGCSGSSTRRSPARRSSRPTVEAPPKVVNLMDALRKSLDAVSAREEEAGEGGRRQSRPREAQARVRRDLGIRNRESGTANRELGEFPIPNR